MIHVESGLFRFCFRTTSAIIWNVVVLTCAGVIVIVAGLGCSSYDRFNTTTATFELDKTSYSVGDTITLTLILRGEDSVRFYENIEHTLHVWLAFRIPVDSIGAISFSNGLESIARKNRDSGGTITYELSDDSPMKLEFVGTLGESDDSTAFVLSFPTLNSHSRIQKEAYTKAVALEIRGHLIPIKPHPVDALEDFVSSVTLTIHPQ